MEFNRRRTLQLIGGSLSGVVGAGCVSVPGPGSGSDGNSPDDDTDGSDPTGTTDDRRPRIDEPPYEITEPECDPPDDGRNPLWLCEHMPAEPSVAFEQVETRSAIFADEGLRLRDSTSDDQYYATFLTEGDHRDRLHDEASEAVVDLIEETAFDSQAVLAVETGWGSGSKTPHLKRIEETNSGVHAFGCIRQPCVWTDDVTVRTVVARFERPTELDGSLVSLTVDPTTRVNVGVQEG